MRIETIEEGRCAYSNLFRLEEDIEMESTSLRHTAPGISSCSAVRP